MKASMQVFIGAEPQSDADTLTYKHLVIDLQAYSHIGSTKSSEMGISIEVNES